MNTVVRIKNGQLVFEDTFRECYNPPEPGDVAILPGRVRPMTVWPIFPDDPHTDPYHDTLDF